MATDQAAFNVVVAQIQNNSTGSFIDLESQGITDADCIPLANALRNNTSVQTLDLFSNSIGDSGATALAQALQVNKVLTNLTLSTNSIGASGATALAQTLQVNMILTILNLYSNSIGNSGAIALAQALQVNTVLNTLHLSYNSIGDSGTISLAQALRVNTALTFLTLRYNSIREGGATALAQALQINRALTQLRLTGNSIGASGYAAIANALRCNVVLTTLEQDNNPSNTLIQSYLNRNQQCANSRISSLQCPILVFRPISVPRSTTMTLSPTQLQITTPLQAPSYTNRTLLNGNFNVSAITNGQFLNAQQQVITQFSQAAVNASQVLLQADNSGLPIICNITASFENFTTCDIPITFNVSNAVVNSTTILTPQTSAATSIATSAQVAVFASTSSSAAISSSFAPTSSLFPISTPAALANANTSSSNGVPLGAVVGGITGIAAVGAAALLYRRYRKHPPVAPGQRHDLQPETLRRDMRFNPLFQESLPHSYDQPKFLDTPGTGAYTTISEMGIHLAGATMQNTESHDYEYAAAPVPQLTPPLRHASLTAGQPAEYIYAMHDNGTAPMDETHFGFQDTYMDIGPAGHAYEYDGKGADQGTHYESVAAVTPPAPPIKTSGFDQVAKYEYAPAPSNQVYLAPNPKQPGLYDRSTVIAPHTAAQPWDTQTYATGESQPWSDLYDTGDDKK